MKVVFRVDSSFEIGTGHLMRCLCLAKHFLKVTHDIVFICRELPGNSIEKVKNEGFKVESLPLSAANLLKQDQDSLYLSWLGETYDVEIVQTQAKIENIVPDLLIVDHYALDSRWESAMRSYAKKIFVIDDLANRKHDCDFLLDQTFGRAANEYSLLLPKSCHQFLGPDFCLLRPEFSNRRQESLQKREMIFQKSTLLISVGGIDKNNVTGTVLGHLIESRQIDIFESVKVILGKNAPHFNDVCELMKRFDHVSLLSDVTEMAEVMVTCDIAIGAAGTSTWERCCLGLPTILLKIAENQTFIFNKMREIGAVVAIEDLEQLRGLDWPSIDYKKLSSISSSLVDGLGAMRVLDALAKTSSIISLIKAKPDDLDFLFLLQSREGVRALSRQPQIPSYQEHVSWFERTLNDQMTSLYILKNDFNKVGMLRVDNHQGASPEVSIIVDPTFSKRGYARQALEILKEKLPRKYIKATVHRENTASKSLFLKSGFKYVGETEKFEEYIFEGEK